MGIEPRTQHQHCVRMYDKVGCVQPLHMDKLRNASREHSFVTMWQTTRMMNVIFPYRLPRFVIKLCSCQLASLNSARPGWHLKHTDSNQTTHRASNEWMFTCALTQELSTKLSFDLFEWFKRSKYPFSIFCTLYHLICHQANETNSENKIMVIRMLGTDESVQVVK